MARPGARCKWIGTSARKSRVSARSGLFAAASLAPMAGPFRRGIRRRKISARERWVNALIWHHLGDRSVNMTDNSDAINYGKRKYSYH